MDPHGPLLVVELAQHSVEVICINVLPCDIHQCSPMFRDYKGENLRLPWPMKSALAPSNPLARSVFSSLASQNVK